MLGSADTVSKQQSIISSLRENIATNSDHFRRVNRYTFQLARSGGQKGVALDAAIEYWRLLFSPSQGAAWNSPTTPWLEWWIEFLQEHWKKTVNRDMWNMTYEFYKRTKEDESMSWWDEHGAWPGVLDDFVRYVNERREKEGKMEIG